MQNLFIRDRVSTRMQNSGNSRLGKKHTSLQWQPARLSATSTVVADKLNGASSGQRKTSCKFWGPSTACYSRLWNAELYGSDYRACHAVPWVSHIDMSRGVHQCFSHNEEDCWMSKSCIPCTRHSSQNCCYPEVTMPYT